ncbi:hypothetical protein K4K58_005454 [Colletotrichum sp. SAR11_239]|nr:hypothetical protein K4K58_005454 [Colletotrichum sp. SAR11_239]
MEPTPTPKSQTSAEFIYEFTPQSYLRIPGLRFDPIDQLIPYPHRAALEFLKPSRFKLDLPWEEYYDLLQPFDDVCFKLVDVLMYATDELRHNVPPRIKKVTAAVGKTDVADETQVIKAKAVEVEYDWNAFFERVLELLGPKGEEFGMCKVDIDLVDESLFVVILNAFTELVVVVHKANLCLEKGLSEDANHQETVRNTDTDCFARLRKSWDELSREITLLSRWQRLDIARHARLGKLCAGNTHTVQLLKQKELHQRRIVGSAARLTANEKFVDWQNGKGRLLWYHGSAGVGKTFAFSRMVDNLELLSQDESIGFAFFYCDYAKSGQQSLQQIVEAITRQLLARKPKLVLEFADRIVCRQASLEDRKDLLKNIIRCYEKTFLVIDAIGELCNDGDEIADLVSFLEEIVQDCAESDVQVCVTSHDLKAWVENVYDERVDEIGWLKGNEDMRDLVVRKVVESFTDKPQNFHLAEQQTRFALRRNSEVEIRDAVSNLSHDLNFYYQDTMSKMTADKVVGPSFINLLRWIMYAPTLIRINEVGLALGLAVETTFSGDIESLSVDVSHLLRLSEGLVCYQVSDLKTIMKPAMEGGNSASYLGTAKLVLSQRTFREFLSTNTTWIGTCDDGFFLEACLRAMTLTPFLNGLQKIWQELQIRLRYPYRANKDFMFDFRGNTLRVPEFLFWALSHWTRFLTPESLTPEAKRMMLDVQQVSQEATAQWKKETDMPLYRYMRLNSEVQQEDNCSTGKKTAYMEHFSLHSTHPLAGPLYWSAEKGSAVGCQLLLPYEEDPNVQFQNEVGQDDTHAFWETALSAAVRYGSPEAVKVLLDDGRVDPNIGRTHYIYGHISPLAQACEDNKKEIIQMLVAREDVDVNAIDRAEEMNYRKYVDARDKDAFEHSRTALMVAAFVGHSEEAALLLQHPQISAGLQDSMGMTPLMLAAVGYARYNVKTVKHERVGSIAAAKDVELEHSFQKHAETVQILLKSETAQVNARDHRGRTALSFAAMCGIEPKSERYGGTGSGYRGTPAWPSDFDEQLSWGTKKDHFESIVRELLAAPDVNVNIADDKGHTSLDYAAWSMEVICKEEHLRLREFDKAIQEAKLEGRGPVLNHDQVAAPVRELLDSVNRVHALLIASGAQSGQPIPDPAIIEEGRGSPVFRMKPVNQ